MQDEIAKRLLLLSAYYGHVGDLFMTKPQVSMALLAIKMVAVLKLSPVSIASDRHTYEFAIMLSGGQLVFVSAEMDGVAMVSLMKQLESQLIAQQKKQMSLFQEMQTPEMYSKCEMKSRPCEFRFKQKSGY